MTTGLHNVVHLLLNIFCIVLPFIVTISPSGPIQGAMVGSPLVINCTVSGVESSSVMISWMGPGGSSIISDSRVTVRPTTSSGNNYSSSLQFTYLMEGDEGTYTCNVMTLETSGSQSVELESLMCESLSIIALQIIKINYIHALAICMGYL